jgi:hypothetical protein
MCGRSFLGSGNAEGGGDLDRVVGVLAEGDREALPGSFASNPPLAIGRDHPDRGSSVDAVTLPRGLAVARL